ncbi:MAG TPA: dihydropteroate synthase [Xanthobacteraceae bacterium]|nr:dihydropteroate synthase [Xanthobacteraceae bacterium]
MRADQRARRDDFLNKLGAHPVVMGILNVTPDSFSDGGRFLEADAAVAHAKAMAAQGCAIIDIGGESTRPGATAVSEGEELARIGTVVRRLANELAVPVSIDTYKASVAARAVELGAILINDVWGLQKDPAMADTVAAAEAAVVIMHNRSDKDEALDVVADLRRFFDGSLALAARANVPEHHIILDPGIGFGKTARQNIEAIARLGELADYGRPIMIGASRKKFFGARVPEGIERGTEGTLVGTLAVNLAAAAAGASLFRVHDVAEHVAALALFAALNKCGAAPPTA